MGRKGAGHQREFGGRDARSPVVVGVQADHGLVPEGEAGGEPLDLVRIDVGRCHFHGRRQIDDDGIVRRRAGPRCTSAAPGRWLPATPAGAAVSEGTDAGGGMVRSWRAHCSLGQCGCQTLV